MTKEQEHVADLAQCWPSAREMTGERDQGHQSVLPICWTDLGCLCSTYDVASQHVASSLFVTFVDLVSVVRLLVCSSVALRLFLSSVLCSWALPPHTVPPFLPVEANAISPVHLGELLSPSAVSERRRHPLHR